MGTEIKREELSYAYKLPSRSVSSIHEQFQDALTYFRRDKELRFRGGKVTGEGMVNALMLYFLGMDRKQQKEFLELHLPTFDAMVLPRLNRWDNPEDEPDSEPDPPPKTAVQGALVEEPKKRKSRRKA